MDQIPDGRIIRGILEHQNRVISLVYKECFPMVEKMVINHGGDHDQAKDVFQEGIIIVYRKLLTGELKLTCKFSTYLYAICKKLWMQEKRKIFTRMKAQSFGLDMVEEPEPNIYKNQRIKKLLHNHFRELSKDCQKLLLLHFNKTPTEEIQRIMNFKDTHYAIDRKYRCKKSLMNRILNDPNFKSIQHEYSEHIRSVY